MDEKEQAQLRAVVLDAITVSLEAQLRAVRRLQTPAGRKHPRGEKRKSQVDLVADILTRAGRELHIREIIERARKVHHVELDRESIVSALTKKVQRGDRFTRTEPNVFGLIAEPRS